jgi:enamine deaminase RidA (YjgF/YER057c/UK114 family)
MIIRRLQSDTRMSQAVIHNGVVYLAGQVGSPGDNTAAQTREILQTIEDLLTEAGTDKSRLLHATIWLADMGDFEAMNAVWDAWIAGQNPPARATGQVLLAAPEYRVEIIVVAALPD